MENDDSQPLPARRVPGANLRPSALPTTSPPVLPDAVVQRVQAAVEAERATPDELAPSASHRESASRSAKRKRRSQPTS